MPLTSAGATEIAKSLLNDSPTFYNNANARVGVGNGTTTFAIGQTDLQGASKQRNGMMATYPTRAGAAMTFRSQFASSEANFDWEEWGVFNSPTANVGMLQRLVQNNGTKTSGQVWEFQVTLTVTA